MHKIFNNPAGQLRAGWRLLIWLAIAVGVLADAASGRVMAEANLLFVFFLARSIHGPARSGKRDFPRQFVKTPTLRQHRGGWGTRKTSVRLELGTGSVVLFACGAFLERDYDGKRKFDFGFLKIFDLWWLGETGIVDHVVFFFLARSKRATAGRRDGASSFSEKISNLMRPVADYVVSHKSRLTLAGNGNFD